MKHFLNAALGVVLVLGMISACSQLEDPLELVKLHTPTTTPLTSASSPTGPTEAVRLIAAKTEDVGTVTCWITDDFLFIEYATKHGWSLAETHLAVAEFLSDIPSTPSANPIVGHFPFKKEHEPFTTVHTVSLNMNDWGFGEAEELYIAAHADVQMLSGGGVVMREEGAWGEGESLVLTRRIDPHQIELPAEPSKDRIVKDPDIPVSGNWAMYFKVNVKKLRGLILWSKLGSGHEVTHSRVGPDGVIVGDIEYLPCKHGNGFKPLPRTGDHNIPDNYIEYRNLGLGPQGCIEFWYLPDWIDWHVGHVVHLFTFGVPGHGFTYLITMEFNDWQNRAGVAILDGFNAANRAGVHFYPYTIPDWSTEEPFHIAVTWDGTVPDPMQRIKLFINGVETGTPWCAGDPTFTNWPDDSELVLRLGTRLGDTQGDWERHNWEGLDGIMDNIKIWSYPKTDFSDRFVE